MKKNEYPWSLLGVDPELTTERDVKAAYARLLKQHRPDIDPQGFQKLREAYLEALAFLRCAAAPSNPGEITPPGEDAPAGEEAPAADEAPERMEFLEQLVSGGGLPGASKQWQQFLSVGSKMPEQSRNAQLLEAFSFQPNQIAQILPDWVVFADLEADRRDLAGFLLESWHQEKQIERMAVFGAGLLRKHCLISIGSNIYVYVSVCRLLAFWNPPLAMKLADLIFQHSRGPVRHELMQAIDGLLEAGKMFDGLPEGELCFWWEVIYDHSKRHDWQGRDCRRHMSRLVRYRGVRWAGFVQLMRTLRSDEKLAFAKCYKSKTGWLISTLDIVLATIGFHKFSRFYKDGSQGLYIGCMSAILVLLLLIAWVGVIWPMFRN